MLIFDFKRYAINNTFFISSHIAHKQLYSICFILYSPYAISKVIIIKFFVVGPFTVIFVFTILVFFFFFLLCVNVKAQNSYNSFNQNSNDDLSDPSNFDSWNNDKFALFFIDSSDIRWFLIPVLNVI